jgi:hypothetical protein
VLVWFIPLSSAAGNVDVYTENDLPLGNHPSDWVSSWWNWNLSILLDEWNKIKSGGCVTHKESSMVMLIDTAKGNILNQRCVISASDGIMIPIWTAECDESTPELVETYSGNHTLCARGFNLGEITGLVKVDDRLIAELNVEDYNTKIATNVIEVYTKLFNATNPPEGHMPQSDWGTFPGVAHGWFVFLKPLPPGEHTVYYQNLVEPTAKSGAGNNNAAQITYDLIVK